MDTLAVLLTEFWKWTGIPQDKWDTVDFMSFGIEAVDFPKIGELCQICLSMINTQLMPNDMRMFLTAMAIDAEDEDILSACKEYAEDDFIYAIVSYGISHPQSEARWQLAELLRRQIKQQDFFLQQLLSDPDAYVRKRTHNVMQYLQQKG